MAGWSVPGVVGLREIREDPIGRRVAARHRFTRKSLAVTYLSAELLADAEFRSRFSGEFPRLARLRVARVHRYVECHDGAAVVGDHVDGTSLRALLLAHGAVGAEAALVVFKDILLALVACHEAGLAHGDVKPENVIVTSAGRIRLVDFGLWTSNSRQLLDRSTPFYLAPEQWSGGPAAPAGDVYAAPAGDVYAATVAFFECSVGAPPFYADRAPELSAKHQRATPPTGVVPEPVRALVRAGLAKDLRGRPDARTLLAQVGDAAARAMGSGWELRGRRELAALLAGRSAALDMSARGFRSADAQGHRHPVRLAAVMGGALMVAAGLATPPLAVILPGSTLFGSGGRSPVLAFPDPARDTPVRVVTNGPLADRAPSPAVQAGTTGPVARARPPAPSHPTPDVHTASSTSDVRHNGSEGATQNGSAPGQFESGQSAPASQMCAQKLTFSVDKPCKAAEQPTPDSSGTTASLPVPVSLPVQLPAPAQLPVTPQLPALVQVPTPAPIVARIQPSKDVVIPKSSPQGWGETRAARHGTSARTDHQPTKGTESSPGWGSAEPGNASPGGTADR